MRILRRALPERGAVLVIVAVVMPVMILFTGLAVDVGNWYLHKRHLQLQADAGAFAGGGSVLLPLAVCSDADVRAATRKYAGADATSFNRQVAVPVTPDVHVLLNAKKHYPDDTTDYTDGKPCDPSKLFVDTKVTEVNLPWFFRLASISRVNAHARVAIQTVSSLSGSMPLGVRDVNPQSAAVIFINDSTKVVLAAKHLVKTGSAGGFSIWSNASEPASVTVATHTSAVIALSNVDSGSLALPASGAAIAGFCAQDDVDCFEYDDSVTPAAIQGLVYVRGYNATATSSPTDPPVAKSVWLTDGTCGIGVDSYFSYIIPKKKGDTCTAGIRANVDIGGRPTGDVELTANGTKLTFGGGTWAATLGFVNAGGAHPVTLDWEVTGGQMKDGSGGLVTCKKGVGSNPAQCKGSFGVVQRHYDGSDADAGPIRVARVWNYDSGSPVGGVNSFVAGSSHQLVAEIRVAGSIATSVSDDPIAFRFVGGSATGSIDCDPTISPSTMRFTIPKGCSPFYARNTRGTTTAACNPPYPNKAILFSSPQPWDCVAIKPGGTVGDFVTGVQGRILNNFTPCGGSCPVTTCPADNASRLVPGRNYWDPATNLYKGASFGHFRLEDPRLVFVFMVPFGAFRVSSEKIFPVVDFGTFYVTGWTGQNASEDDPCPGADQPARKAGVKVPGGMLYGHFINYSLPTGTATGSGGTCDLSIFTPCVPVLVD